MISSRCPRPIGIIESIALSPVWTGSFTGWRSITPGALNSSGLRSLALIGPAPSTGWPRGFTIRPTSSVPTGTLATVPVRLTGCPSLTFSHSPKSAAPTLSSSRLKARSVSTSYSSIRCLRIEVISSGRSFTGSPLGESCRRQLAAEPLQAAAHARVEAVGADLQDDAADQIGVDAATRLDLAARGLLDLVEQLARVVVRKLDRGREVGVDDPFVLGDQPLELARDLLELGRAALLDEHEQEVAQELLAAGQHVLERRGARSRVELWVAQQLTQLGHLVLGGDDLRQLLADGVERALGLRRLEECVRVDAVDHTHARTSCGPSCRPVISDGRTSKARPP